MGDGLTDDLLWAAMSTGVLSLILAIRQLPFIVAAVVVLIRFAIPIIYFAWYFDGSWTILDDFQYLADSGLLLNRGYTPVTILVSSEGPAALAEVAGGHHTAYIWWNMLAQHFLGEHYYAPCFLNILITFVTCHIFGKTLQLLKFSKSYSTPCQVFLLLHWDIAAWSSFINLKDILVQCLTVASLHCAISFIATRRVRYITCFFVLGFVFYWIRFYVPFLIVASVGLWMISQWRRASKYYLAPIVLLGAYCLSPDQELMEHFLSPTSALSGVVRFTLTPQPWSIDPAYSFLLIPSVLHWLLIFPGVYGAWSLWHDCRLARIFVIYAVICIFAYAINEELLGTRQRLQVSFIFAWVQFHCLWQFRQSHAVHVAPPAAVPAFSGRLKAA